MEFAAEILAVLSVLLLFCLYSLILVLRDSSRTLERERNVHNLQVSELLDRLAWKENKPYGLPPRPDEPKQEPEQLETHWREV